MTHHPLRLPLAAIAAAAGLAGAAPTAETLRIGQTPDSRAIEVIALGEPDARDERPALLIVAGLQGHHAIGRTAARALADRLLADHAELLATHTVYVIPDANPDAHARWADAQTKADFGRAPQPTDADRDGRADEDAADDLNADGMITLMRVPAPTAQTLRYAIRPTVLIDPEDPRLTRAPKPEDAESATHALLIEGLDDDNDGAFNEDGWAGASGGGVDLDRHFPIHWPEHTDGAGLYPLARPEARALVEWAQSRGNIVAVLVYGPHDTLSAVPPAGKFPPPGRVPSGIEEGDKAWHETISELYKEHTNVTKPGDGPERDGSFLQWAYADLGVFAFGSPVWHRPDLVKKEGGKPDAGTDEQGGDAAASGPADPAAAERAALLARGVPAEIAGFITMTAEERAAEIAAFSERSPEEIASLMAAVEALPAEIRARVTALAQGGADPGPMLAQARPAQPAAASRFTTRPAQPAARGGGRPANARGANDSADAKWLEWIDARGDASESLFVEWQPYDHPQLGAVEIGGFAPGARVNPPHDDEAALIDQQTAFVADLIGRLPRLEIDEPTVERVGNGLWRIGLTARNTGFLPTVSAIGVKTRRLPPLVFALDPDLTVASERIVSGSRLVRFDAIDGSGQTVHASWLVATGDASEIAIAVRTPRFEDRTITVRLEESSDPANANGGDQ